MRDLTVIRLERQQMLNDLSKCLSRARKLRWSERRKLKEQYMADHGTKPVGHLPIEMARAIELLDQTGLKRESDSWFRHLGMMTKTGPDVRRVYADHLESLEPSDDDDDIGGGIDVDAIIAEQLGGLKLEGPEV